MTLRTILSALVGVFLLGGTARADFVFQFAGSNGVATSNFGVAQGSTVDVRVYLVQTNGPTVNSTNLSANGLSDGNVALTFSSTAPFSIASASNITPNSAFVGPNGTSLTTSGGTTTATLQVHSSPAFVFAPTSGADANRILLGTFTFTGVSPGSALTVTALPNAGSNFVDGAGNTLDSLISNASAAITVTAIPEPGTVILTGLFAAGFGAHAWRRRRRAAAV
jgi:hypothetical protein